MTGWAATNTLREIVFTVEECNERIADAQHVLDNPNDYPIDVRVDADKAVRRYTRLREGAAKLALVEAALDAAADLSHWTRRMLQALDAYWLHYDGYHGRGNPLSGSTAEDWWIRFEKYRARVEAALRAVREGV